MKEQQEVCRSALASLQYRKFLQHFKTKTCPSDNHAPEFCTYYHLQCAIINVQLGDSTQQFQPQPFWITRDRRRNPYGKLNKIKYFAEYCSNIPNGCQNQECQYCHNIWQYNYHPLVFKTVTCERFYDCNYEFCSMLHFYDYAKNPKAQASVFRFSEFFRFDIMTFKSIPCKKQYNHDKNLCLFYHNVNDYRRPGFESYDHTKCKKVNEEGCFDSNCPYSHNKIEQLYHPSRYKSKFCETHEISRKNASETSSCPYDKFCSFAHDDSQISIELIDKLERNLEFHLYAYKTVWCPITTDHNRYNCVYAHNVQDFRRNPKQFHYEAQQCPMWKKNQNIKSFSEAGCPDGMNCKKCHGWKQKQYHPIIYCKPKIAESSSKNKSDIIACSDGGKQKIQSPYFNNKKKSQMLYKKLGAQFTGKTNLQSIVQTIYNQKIPKKQVYAPGAPFFKNNQRSKGKYQSQQGDACKDQAEQEKISRGQQSIMTTKSIAIKGSQKDDSQDIDDTQIFKAFQSGNEKTCDQKRSCINWTQKNDSEHGKGYKKPVLKVSRTVSRSVGFNSREKNNYYSKDVSEALNPQILNVLRNRNISQIKLINMKQQQVRKIEELTNSQKSLIIKKILLVRDNARKTPTYEDLLEKHFLRHKRLDTLAKMKNKKVKQQKLLLLDSSIKSLSFLSESEKRILPKIIAEFKDNYQFQQLNVEIAKSLSPETQLVRQ